MAEENKLKKLRNRLIAVYTILGIILSAAAGSLIICNSNQSLEAQLENHTLSLASQYRKSMNSFLLRIEKAGTSIFEDDETIAYYPPENGVKTFEELQQEQQLTDKMISLSLMENYCDFGIIYRNGESAGKISDGTSDIFGPSMFEAFYGHIEKNSDSVWISEHNSRFSRLYYIKKINENALLLTSVYTTELDTVFQSADSESRDMIYLIDSSGNVIYSSENASEQIGDVLPENMSFLTENSESIIFSRDGLIGALAECSAGWKVISCAEADGIFNGKANAGAFILAFFSVSAVILIFSGYIASMKYTSEADKNKGLFDSEEVDTVTGLLNGMALEEEISDRIETCLPGSTYAFILIRIKDFDEIKMRLGCDYANEALKKTGDLISASFGSDDIIGINEQDEFTVFADFSDFDLFKAHSTLKARCDSLCTSFKGFFAGENQEHKLYFAVGVCVYPDSGKTFDELYKCAAKALSLSLKAEKDSCVYYESINKHTDRK
ncbi:diguanylate cyclase [Ruminococcus sp. Marseille-P6503]|uniref:sensor domain-containing diguanylate cyclase n=1 Tax=Ruminococcus sp. Marseille-P6503 TaxID=2364796 RepID=UPI000F52AC4B|nr:diguanylate cyclase [Ruminococcus sp. Marseille-P6503]